jgi:hypothetical protein
MYRIIGADGKEYGPVPAQQLRQWIGEERVNAQTRIIAEGSMQWSSLGSLPEFSASVNPTPPSVIHGSLAPVRKTNTLAMAGMILGILALTLGLCCYGLPFNVLGLVFSVIGLAQVRSQPELYDGQGLAIAGIVLCVLSILFTLGMFLLFGVMAAVGHPPDHHIYRL